MKSASAELGSFANVKVQELKSESVCHHLSSTRYSLQALLWSALQSGGLEPRHVAHLTVHGTGTPLGDPIEIGAIAGALGTSRQLLAAPMALGSVKASYC